MATYYAHKTVCLTELIRQLDFTTQGEVGAHRATVLKITCSLDTFLRLVRKIPLAIRPMLLDLYVPMRWVIHLAVCLIHHRQYDRFERRDKSVFRLGCLWLRDILRLTGRLFVPWAHASSTSCFDEPLLSGASRLVFTARSDRVGTEGSEDIGLWVGTYLGRR